MVLIGRVLCDNINDMVSRDTLTKRKLFPSTCPYKETRDLFLRDDAYPVIFALPISFPSFLFDLPIALVPIDI